MASAADDSGTIAPPVPPPNIFNEDEDLLDDEDDDDSEDESASSAPDRGVPSSVSVSLEQVTVAVPGVPVMRVDQDLHHHQQHQHQQPEIVVAKKPPPPDESRKLFQRLWTDEDEIELLKGFLEYTTQRGGPHSSSSHHHHDTTAFYDQIKSKFQLDFNKNQLVEKLRRLKKKYRNVINKFGAGKDYAFKSPHEQTTFEISAKIWGNAGVNFNGAPAFRGFPAPIDEDDEESHIPHFIDCQSPNPNGIDVNSKTPRSRKRSRPGAVKLEEKHHQYHHHHHAFNSNPLNNQPPPMPMPPPMAPPPAMGMGLTGSLTGVVEEAVKNCLSPILKELLGNSSGYIPNAAGLCCGHGYGLSLGPMPLGLSGAVGGDKLVDPKWRKQQILELEVFSKRLELVQEQIIEQLHELRSIGN
ncbi:probable transcription factor At3g04930 [Andrographis paniculata]|uniref:probable transcription factor At3g04930 n=1 Tax=Andrographis paniculata TaxID=175694 RepID=UPI0021E7B215|nr:probable transcription factor At3g04930 [Andrographis paniculata]